MLHVRKLPDTGKSKVSALVPALAVEEMTLRIAPDPKSTVHPLKKSAVVTEESKNVIWVLSTENEHVTPSLFLDSKTQWKSSNLPSHVNLAKLGTEGFGEVKFPAK